MRKKNENLDEVFLVARENILCYFATSAGEFLDRGSLHACQIIHDKTSDRLWLALLLCILISAAWVMARM